MSLIITIGRQFGSGGRDVGEKVAEYFNIPFYDKELVELAAQKSNISKEALKEVGCISRAARISSLMKTCLIIRRR